MCERKLECLYRDHPNYCPLEANVEVARGTHRNRFAPIQFWGQRNK